MRPELTSEIEAQIREIVDRETEAWNRQDVAALLSVFHPDMVWPWPASENAHDPSEWTWGLGRFDEVRWREVFTTLFSAHDPESAMKWKMTMHTGLLVYPRSPS